MGPRRPSSGAPHLLTLLEVESVVRHHQQLLLELALRSEESFSRRRWKKSPACGAAPVKAPGGKAHGLSMTMEWIWKPVVARDGPEQAQAAGQLDVFLSTC